MNTQHPRRIFMVSLPVRYSLGYWLAHGLDGVDATVYELTDLLDEVAEVQRAYDEDRMYDGDEARTQIGDDLYDTFRLAYADGPLVEHTLFAPVLQYRSVPNTEEIPPHPAMVG